MNDYVDKTVEDIDRGALPQWITDHVRAYQESDGAQGHYWDATAVGGDGPVPCLLLTTIGRRSGKATTHPLVYGTDGDRYVIVASIAGSPTHPPWYHNLVANPELDVEVGGEKFRARADIIGEPERTALYAKIVEKMPIFGEYQSKTERVIPLIALSRI